MTTEERFKEELLKTGNANLIDAYADFAQELSDMQQSTIKTIDLLNDKLVKKLNIDDVSVSFSNSEKEGFIDTTIFLNSQNLTGRETEDELYKQGMCDCFDDLIEKINER